MTTPLVPTAAEEALTLVFCTSPDLPTARALAQGALFARLAVLPSLTLSP